MVAIDVVLNDVLDYNTTRPFCYTNKKFKASGEFIRGFYEEQGFQFNVFKNTKTEFLVSLRYRRNYVNNLDYPSKRKLFGIDVIIDNFVYGALYAGVAAYLFSLKNPLPIFIGWTFHSLEPERDMPKRYVKGVRYAHKDLILVGKIILEEWLKMKRKENPSFMLETLLN